MTLGPPAEHLTFFTSSFVAGQGAPAEHRIFTTSSFVAGQGAVADHLVEVLGGRIRGPQIGSAEITLDRIANATGASVATGVSVSLSSSGVTELFTATQKTLILGVALRITNADTVTAPAQVSVGVNPSTNNVFANETLTNIDAVDDLYHFWNNLNTAVVLNASDRLDISVNTPATATSLLASAYVIGVVL